MSNSRADVFSYTDYRSFLKSHAEQKKKDNPKWSFGLWARKLQLNSTSALTMILHGKRQPGDRVVREFVKYFRFNSRQADYFIHLVQLEKAKSGSPLKVLIMEKLARFHPRGQFNYLDDSSFQSLSQWYYCAIREIVLLPGFEEDPTWIAKQLRFPVSLPKIKKALEDLIRTGLLKRDPKTGKLIQTDATSLSSPDDVAYEGFKRLHEAMIENAKKAVRSVSISNRQISGVTMNVCIEDFEKAREFIRKFECDFLEFFEASQLKAGRNYCTAQLNVQFFPLTKILTKKGDENEVL